MGRWQCWNNIVCEGRHIVDLLAAFWQTLLVGGQTCLLSGVIHDRKSLDNCVCSAEMVHVFLLLLVGRLKKKKKKNE